MATWQELSQDNIQAATKLLREGHPRSSVSRAYYAAYCAVAGELVLRHVQFAHGWNNPAHDQLPDLILHNTGLPRNTRFQINKLLRRLRRGREDADYRPHISVEHRDAVALVRDALFIVQMFGGWNE